jgi:hypothetical protein
MKTRKVVHSMDALQRYVSSMNGKDNLTTTVYGFRDLKPGGKRGEYSTAIIPHFVIDLDKGRATETLGLEGLDAGERCAEDTWKLSAHLLTNGWRHAIWFTGGGFHIWILLDQTYELAPEEQNDLLFSGRALLNGWIREMDLATVDPVVSFRPDRHIRIPNTYNFKRGLWSIPLSMGTLSSGWEVITEIAERPSFGMFLMGKKGMPLEIIDRNDPESKMLGLTGFFKKFDAAEIAVEMANVSGIPVLPCLNAACCEKGGNPPHQARVYLMMYLMDYFRKFARPGHTSKVDNGKVINKAHAFIEGLEWADYNPRITREMLVHGAGRYYLTPTCPTIYEAGYCVGKCPYYDGKGVEPDE